MLAVLASLIVAAGLDSAPDLPQFEQAVIRFGGQPAPAATLPASGFSLIAAPQGPQLAVTHSPTMLSAAMDRGDLLEIDIPLRQLAGPLEVSADVEVVDGGQIAVVLSAGREASRCVVSSPGRTSLRLAVSAGVRVTRLGLSFHADAGSTAVRCSAMRLRHDQRSVNIPIVPPACTFGLGPPPTMPPLQPAIEAALIDWDWRMQDGIETQRAPSTYAAAVTLTLKRGDDLLDQLRQVGTAVGNWPERWDRLHHRCKALLQRSDTDETTWESLWREVHQVRRAMLMATRVSDLGPLLFVKRVPSAFSHQLTQYYGADARPGGGLFVLDRPGQSMHCRQLGAASLATGSYMHPEVSPDGQRILFAFCRVDQAPTDRHVHAAYHYHLYEMSASGTQVKQLTDGPYDDFSPRYLPSEKIVFVSTRRGGFHRCGRGPCPTYTLTVADADGSHPRPISFHETHEWDPVLGADGRVIYTRWDYVDRHAVYYEQLWSVRPDGTDVRIFYGNNTLNPVGIWEARPVPGSQRIMATAAAHHAMTAGSIILLDTTRGMDGPDPITRLTPDALFPESEAPVLRRPTGSWHAPAGVTKPPDVPPAALRWPGHCYRSPFPLAEDCFLAAYSFDPLIGEPTANSPNMFGIYLVDRFGNKELLYRDLNIASLWPVPLRPRPVPPAVPTLCEERARTDQEPSGRQGAFFLHDVHASWPALPDEPITRLRIVQVLPKSTPNIDDPKLGIPSASPGKQVLGTVPVEDDGSAYFRAPTGIPLSFQALDRHGRAVQIMRSVTYLQPGETCSCIGCHEPRTSAPPPRRGIPTALRRAPSTIAPGPEGAKPLSYPRLVQPVLDRHCTRCHNATQHAGNIVLTGEPEGHYTRSYNALASRVPYSAWPRQAGDFRVVNSEPLSQPGHFGARASRLMDLLIEGHEGVQLPAADRERLATWMDTNVLFYGTFHPTDQARQQRGEVIAGPGLQ